MLRCVMQLVRQRMSGFYPRKSAADAPLGYCGSEPDLCRQVSRDAVDADSLLRSRIAVAGGDGLILECLAVDSEADGASRFVHPGVALADAGFRIVLDEAVTSELLRELGGELFAYLGHAVLVHEREHCCLDGGQAGVNAQQLGARAAGVLG